MAVYKDHLFAARCRLQQLNRCQRGPILPWDLAKVYIWRQGRIWGGAAGVAGFLVMVVAVASEPRHATPILLLTWVAMALALLLGLGGAWLRLRRAARRCSAPTGDVFLDLARLELGAAVRMALHRSHRLERASLALPLCAFTLLAPLSLHLLFGVVFLEPTFHQFDNWIAISLMLVGHAHLTLMILAILHVVRLGRELDWGLPVGGAPRGLRALAWTTLASAVPGIFLLAIPPLLVFITGLAFVPWVFAWASRRARTERQRLEDCGLVLQQPDGSEG